MEINILLYPYSRSEAKGLRQLSDWKSSYQANVACAREIENAIRLYFREDGQKAGEYLKEGCAKSILDRWGFKRTNFVLANTVNALRAEAGISEANQSWLRTTYVPPDKEHNRRFEVDTAEALLDDFISGARQEFQKLGLFDPTHCEPDSRAKLDYEGKVLVLSTRILRESCWTPQDQLWLAHDGFGCSPTAIGRSIRCTCLGDGEETRWNRADFTGVLKDEFLPDWAAEKLYPPIRSILAMPGADPQVCGVSPYRLIIGKVLECPSFTSHGFSDENGCVNVYCIPDAQAKGLPFNCRISGEEFYGPILINGMYAEDRSLTDHEISKYLDILHAPHTMLPEQADALSIGGMNMS